MKSLSEPIARRANEEDKVTGRFWESRFGCQALLSEKSILAAMVYVDLKPVRAKAADYIELVDFTGRELHPGKRGKIDASEPKALTKLGVDKNHWTTRVKGAVIRTIN